MGHKVITGLDVFVWVLCDEDALSLAATVRLANVSFILLESRVVSQIGIVGWQAPRLRKERVVLGKHFGHAVHVPGQKVLAANLAHARIVVDLLPPLHLIDAIDRHAQIRPEDRPVLVLLDLLEAQLAPHSPHTVVLRGDHTDADLLLFALLLGARTPLPIGLVGAARVLRHLTAVALARLRFLQLLFVSVTFSF